MTEVLTTTTKDEPDRGPNRWWSGAPRSARAVLADVDIDEPRHAPFVRSWSDAVQVGTAGLVLVAMILLVRAAPEGIRGIERDLAKPIDSLPSGASSLVVAMIQVVAAYAPFAVITAVLVGHRLRGLALIVVAAIASGVLMRLVVVPLLDVPAVARSAARFDFRGFTTGGAFPSPVYITAAVAVVTVEMPWLSRPWRRALVVVLAVLGIGRLAAGTARDLPIELPAAYAAGWFVGCVVLLAFGRPNRRPHGRDVVQALARSGVGLSSIRATSVRRAYRRDFEGVDDAGRRIFVKIREGDDRAAEAAVRLLRYLRVRDVTDEHPFWSPIRRSEHEALVALKAHADGVPAPVVRAVTTVGSGGNALVAVDRFDGRLLDDLVADEWTDDLLARVWNAVGQLHDARISHRDLRPGNLVVAPSGDVMILNFTNAELGAGDHQLANDTAELLSSTAVRVGAPRAVAAALDAIGADGLLRALPRLQPLALSGPTRVELRGQPDLLDEVVDLVRDVCGADTVEPDQLERVKPRKVVMFVMSAFALYALLPQLAQAPNIITQLTRADWVWVAGALAASAVTYLGAATALSGASPERLPFATTAVAQLGAQFANFATPASVGGYALNVRYLRKRGAETPVAVAAVGLNAVAGVVVHLSMLAALAYWAGSEDELKVALPVRTLVIVGALIVVGAVATLLVPLGRSFARDRIMPFLERSASGIREIALRPLKLTELVGGAFILTSSYIVSLVCSLHAFGADLPVATVGVVFLAGAAVAAAVPTPGGLGAVEAALVAGLLGVGVDSTTAVSAVIVHRVATFWLPLPPGWLAFTALQRRGTI